MSCSYRRIVIAILLFLSGLGISRFVVAKDGPNKAKLNEKIEDVRLVDAEGKPAALHALKDKKALVVVFLSFDCPIARSFLPTLADLSEKYRGKQVAFLGVCCHKEEHFATKVKEFKIPFPVCQDEGCRAADAFQAEFTPEAFVLDDQFVLR